MMLDALPPQSAASIPRRMVESGGQGLSATAVRYLGAAPVQVRGPATGRVYAFSAKRPVMLVDSRDAAVLLRTRFFRRAS